MDKTEKILIRAGERRLYDATEIAARDIKRQPAGSTVEILKKARAFLENGWIQGNAAMTYWNQRTRNGNYLSVSPFHERACRFCADGAISAAIGQKRRNLWGKPRRILADLIREEYRTRSLKGVESLSDIVVIAGWNDHPDRTQDEVLAMFDRAIEAAG